MAPVSAIVPTFNRAQLLRETLDAIFAQTTSPCEIIVVDDGSTPDTAEMLAAYPHSLTVLRSENRGKSAALNLALARARGEYIWIVDDDDLPCRDALQNLLACLAKDTEARFVYGRHARFQDLPRGRIWLDQGHWSDCSTDDFHTATMEDFFAHQPGMLVARSAYEEVGSFDERLARSQDYEMLVRLACRFRGAFCDRVVFHQRIHSGRRGRSGKRFSADQREQRWIEADRTIFKRFRSALPLSAYLPRNETASEALDWRRALLQRACIMARKKLWAEAIIDLKQAIVMDFDPLTSAERGILRRFTYSKFGCGELLKNSGVIDALAETGRTNALAAQACAEIAKGLAWRIRAALRACRFSEAAGLTSVAMQLSLPAVFWRSRPATSLANSPQRSDQLDRRRPKPSSSAD